MAITEDLLVRNIRDFANLSDEPTSGTLLFSSGALDSVAMLNLITFVEERTGIEIRADEVTLENFDTIERILRFAEERGA
jgi:acyl carrier protein